MSVEEDIKNKQNQSTQAETAVEREKILNAIKKRNEELAKRQKEAKKLLESKKAIYDLYITQLSTGKSKGKKLSDFKLQQIRTAAEDLNKELADLRKLIAQKPEVVKLPTAPKPQAVKSKTVPTQSLPSGFTPAAAGTQPSAQDAIKSGTLRTPLPNKPPKKGTAVSGTFDPAAARRGEEASMVGVSPTGTATIGDVIAKASQMYGGIDEIFRTDTELADLLRKAVGDINDPLDDYDVSRFTSELENTKWFKTNAGPIRQRGFYKRQYEALTNQLKTDDPNYKAKIEELDRTSEYGRGLVNAIESVREEVTKQGRQVDEDTIRKIAQDLYDYSNESDAVKIRNAVLGAGKYALGGIVAGEAGESLTELRKVARANGLDLDTLFASSVPTWLDRIAKGESVETFKNVIRQTAKTTWKADDRVSSLLDQGVDLDTIYSPYKSLMASTLEIPSSTITFNDLAAKGVIGGKDPLNLYDFEKQLRKDTRWQYTKSARDEMAGTAMELLRNFGFMG